MGWKARAALRRSTGLRVGHHSLLYSVTVASSPSQVPGTTSIFPVDLSVTMPMVAAGSACV